MRATQWRGNPSALNFQQEISATIKSKKTNARYENQPTYMYQLVHDDEVRRTNFLNQLSNHAPDKLIYIDESGIDKFISREYGRGLKGEKVIGEISGKRYARESFIAGQLQNQILAPVCYTGTCDSTLFNFWLENFLLPTIGEGYTLIMDNASFHKSDYTKKLIKQANCQLLFLPPYSPDLNPIEKSWAIIKAKIKKLLANT